VSALFQASFPFFHQAIVLTRLLAEEIYEDVYITPPAILAAPQPQQIFVTHTHVQANV